MKLFRHYILNLFVFDPTENWKKMPEIELTFDFFNETLNHIALNDPVHKLIVFGKPSNKNPHRRDTYEWKSKGLRIHVDQGRVDAFEFVFGDFWQKKERVDSFEFVLRAWQKKWKEYNPAKLKIIKGKTIELSEATNKSEIREFIGQPTDEFSSDEVPSLMYYHYPNLTVELQFGLRDELLTIWIFKG